MNVYFISGLGADYRIFRSVRLPEGYEPRFIKWVAPRQGESLNEYALRLTEQMDLTQPFAVAGLSLGGIMAVEIAKTYRPVATILISSIPLSRQMPRYFRWARYVGLTRVVPMDFLKWLARVKRTMTAEKDEDKALIYQLIRESDNGFMKWAVDAVLRWKNEVIPEPLYHIHGTWDEVFPIIKTRPTHTISKGNHMLLLVHAERVNGLLSEILSDSAAKAWSASAAR